MLMFWDILDIGCPAVKLPISTVPVLHAAHISEPEMCYRAAFASLMHPHAASSASTSVYLTVAGDLHHSLGLRASI